MANGNVDAGAPPDLSAGGSRISERFAGCGVGAAGAADSWGGPWRTTRKTDMRAAMNAILYLLRTGCPWRYLPRDGFPPRSTVYNIFRKFQREGTWEAIWAELHMALRERLGREASPSAAVLDSQSLKSAEKGAVKTTQWVTTPARR
jgi:transposase